jgi:hypothetical protein
MFGLESADEHFCHRRAIVGGRRLGVCPMLHTWNHSVQDVPSLNARVNSATFARPTGPWRSRRDTALLVDAVPIGVPARRQDYSPIHSQILLTASGLA